MIAQLLARLGALERRMRRWRPRTPRCARSSTCRRRRRPIRALPPSQGRKARAKRRASRKASRTRARTGSCIPIRPGRLDVCAKECPHCGGDVSGAAQSALERYDRIELPEIKPDVTRVVLHGGAARAVGRLQGGGAGRVRARLAVRAEPAGLGHLSALYPGHLVRTALAADVRPRRARDQRRRARQHARRQPPAFARADEPHPRQAVERHDPAIGRDQRAGRQEEPGGPGCSIMASKAASASAPAAARTRWRLPGRASSRLLGLRPPRRADGLGQEATIRSASPISSARRATPSRPATRPSRRPCASCSAAPAASAAGVHRPRRRHAARLCLQPRRQARRAHAPNAHPCGGHQAARGDRRAAGGTCSSSSKTAPSRPPTTAPSRRCAPASSSAR